MSVAEIAACAFLVGFLVGFVWLCLELDRLNRLDNDE